MVGNIKLQKQYRNHYTECGSLINDVHVTYKHNCYSVQFYM